MSAPAPDGLLEFWYADARESDEALRGRVEVWFRPDPDFDAQCARRYGPALDQALNGHLDDWAGTPLGRLALVVLLDQLPRNIHRGSARAFAGDERALALTLEAIDCGADRALSHPIERQFLYMPLEHAEDLDIQETSVRMAEALVAAAAPGMREILERGLDAARQHREIVARFGRFPHRNAVLGRESTRAEVEYLAGDSPRFGQ